MRSKRLVIPCLRGEFGNWRTFSCLMRLSDISELVGFAHDLHNIDKLSDQIQRNLEPGRGKDISDYILQNDDRFFNSLVVAIYDGEPCWHEISNIRPTSEEALQLDFPEYAENCAGFLSINRQEKLFALDGQHRVEGIKQAYKKDPSIGSDLLSVIIIKHESSVEGIKRSRRLFTTLNKKAQEVSEEAIIALDDEDISACITRGLIEDSHFTHFNESNISFQSGAIRSNDTSNITTISNVYKNVKKLVSFFAKTPVNKLDSYKPESTTDVTEFVYNFFNLTFFHCEELRSVTSNMDPVKKFRNKESGGHLLFRPIGWDIFVDIIIGQLQKSDITIEQSIKHIFTKDLSLNGSNLEGVLWSTSQKRLKKDITSNKMSSLSKKLTT